MSNHSAVDFPGACRIHIALNVTDLNRSRDFYQLLFGVSPSKERSDYVKFEPEDPSVNLALNQVDTVSSASTVSHFGVQVKTVTAVHEAIERFKARGIATKIEEQTTCCYAVQDKVWVTDPDGNEWEVFVVLQADAKDESAEPDECCTPDVTLIDSSSLISKQK